MTVVYDAIDGVGLGHLMRLSAIALEVTKRAPELPQHLVTATGWHAFLARLPFAVTQIPNDERAPSGARDRRFVTLPKEQHVRLLDGIIGALDASLVVMDTHPSLGLLRLLRKRKVATALVLRELKPAAMSALSESGALAAVDELWIPHALDEMDAALPEHLAALLRPSARVHWTGPVAFPADVSPDAVARVCAKHAIEPDQRVVVAAFGGGGYAPAHRAHLSSVARALTSIVEKDAQAKAIVIAGPLARSIGEQSKHPRVTFVAEELDMQPLLMRADAFVSHGGYNTVVEVLRTGVPAALSGIARKNEDQNTRLTRLAASGRIEVLEQGAPVDVIAATVRTLLQKPRPSRVEVRGGEVAAERVLARVATKRPLIVRDDETLRRARASTREAVVRGDVAFVSRALAAMGRLVDVVLEVDGDAVSAACGAIEARCTSITVAVRGVSLGQVESIASSLRDHTKVKALVACVDGDDDERFRVLEACRLLELPFLVDVTDPRAPRVLREN